MPMTRSPWASRAAIPLRMIWQRCPHSIDAHSFKRLHLTDLQTRTLTTRLQSLSLQRIKRAWPAEHRRMGIDKIHCEYVEEMTEPGGWPDIDETSLSRRANDFLK